MKSRQMTIFVVHAIQLKALFQAWAGGPLRPHSGERSGGHGSAACGCGIPRSGLASGPGKSKSIVGTNAYRGHIRGFASRMTARIYKPARTAMQSGTAKTKGWVLEFEPEAPRVVEPLMGWTSSTDMKSQVRLRFASSRGSGRLLRAGRDSLPGVRAERADPTHHCLCRQFRVPAARSLDPLTSLPAVLDLRA